MTTLKTPPKSILVPIDFSDSSAHAAAAACMLATKTGASLHLLHAYLIPAEPVGRRTAASQKYLDQFVKESRAQLLDLAAKHCPDAELGSVMVESGDPREVITRVARDLKSELIVMGTHGRRGVTWALMGSVAEAVVRTAPCSVLVVR